MTNKSDPRQEWATPPEFMKPILEEFNIRIDVSASEDNAVAKVFYTIVDDGTKQPWFNTSGIDTAWCNPGFKNMTPWIKKAISEVSGGPNRTALVMGLVNPSAKWWGIAEKFGAEIRLLTPRPQFIPAPGVKKSSNAKENCVIIFRTPPAKGKRPAHIWRWDWKGKNK